jgi:hypothetical protein
MTVSRPSLIFRDEAGESSFEKDGYCVLSLPTLYEACRQALVTFDKWSDNYKAATYQSTFSMNDPVHRHAVHDDLVSFFCPLIECELVSFRVVWAGFAVKHPSGTLSRLKLHQDVTMCDLGSGRPAVTAWVPLQDTTCHGGGMSMVPKPSYFRPKPRAYGQLAEFELCGIEGDIESMLVPVNVHLGEALFFHQALLHSSSGNFGAGVRVAVMLMCVPVEKPVLLYQLGTEGSLSVPDDFYVRNRMVIRHKNHDNTNRGIQDANRSP